MSEHNYIEVFHGYSFLWYLWFLRQCETCPSHGYTSKHNYYNIAVDLAKEQKLNYGDDMTSILRQARKRCFQLREEQRIAQDIELQSYLNQLIVEDAERSLAALKEQEAAKDADGKSEGEALSIELIKKKEEVEEKRDMYMAHLNDLFSKVDERRRVSLYFLIMFSYV